MENMEVSEFDDEIKLTPEAEDVLKTFEGTPDYALFKRFSKFMDLGQLESEQDKKKRILLEKNLEAETEHRERLSMNSVGESSLKIGKSFAEVHNEKITREILRIPEEINKELMEEFSFISDRIEIRDLIEKQTLHKVLFQVPYILNIREVVKDFQLKNKPPMDENEEQEFEFNPLDNPEIGDLLHRLPSETTVSERVGFTTPTKVDQMEAQTEGSKDDDDEDDEAHLPKIRICSAKNLFESSPSNYQNSSTTNDQREQPRINISTSIFEDSDPEEESFPKIQSVKSLHPNEIQNTIQTQQPLQKKVFFVRRREPRQAQLHGGLFEKKSNEGINERDLEVTRNEVPLTYYKHKKPGSSTPPDIVTHPMVSSGSNVTLIPANSTAFSSFIQAAARASSISQSRFPGGQVGQIVQIRPREDGKTGKFLILQRAPAPVSHLRPQASPRTPPLPQLIKIRGPPPLTRQMNPRIIPPVPDARPISEVFKTPTIVSSRSVAQDPSVPSDDFVNSPSSVSMAKAALAEKASFPTRKIINGVMHLGCRTCSKTFPASCETMYRNHLLVKHSIVMENENELTNPNDTQWFKCRRCEQIFFSGFKKHQMTCCPEVPFTETFDRFSMAMTQIGKIICGICKKAFSTRMSLRSHLTGFHKEVGTKVILDPIYRCSICLLRYDDSVELLRHTVLCMQMSPTPRPSHETVLELAKGYLECEVCEKAHDNILHSRDCYTQHSLIRCPMCLHTMHVRGNFFNHLKVYHGRDETGSFSCPFCDDDSDYNVRQAIDHILNRHFAVELYNDALRKKVQLQSQKSMPVSISLASSLKAQSSRSMAKIPNSPPSISSTSHPRLVPIRPKPSANASTSTVPMGFTPMRLMPNLTQPLMIEKTASNSGPDISNSIRIVSFDQISEIGHLKAGKQVKTSTVPSSLDISWNDEDGNIDE